MEVILAEYFGFCYGVKRAIKIAKENADGKTSTLGPIIHNPQMVERLKAEGVGMVENLDEMKEGTIIIRSHGVGPQVYEKIQAKDLKIVDATCPHVKKAQMSARSLEGRATILENESEAENFAPCPKLGIVSQTTVSGAHFKKIVLQLLDKSKDIKILRTICTATDQRQTAAMELASKVDVMLVVGGRNSANTTKLAKLCESKCTTYHIETAQEILPEWFTKSNKVGITAGASTPDWIIREVHDKCQRI